MPSAKPKDSDAKTADAKAKDVKAEAAEAADAKDAKADEAKTAKKTTKTTKKKTTKKAGAKKAAKKTKRIRVRQVKSGIRHPWRMRRTLTALGLKHHQDEVVLPDNPSVRGMVNRVHHLVSVTPEDTNG